MIEGQLGISYGRIAVTREKTREAHAAAQCACHLFRLADIIDDDGALDRLHLLQNVADLFPDADGLAGIIIAIAGDEDLRRDLAEAVEDAALAEVGRARRPDGAERGGGQKTHDRFRHVGNDSANPVAGFDACRGKGAIEARHRRVKLAPAHAALDPVLAAEHQCIPVIGFPQQVFGIVQFGVGKEAGARHLIAVDQHAIAAVFRLHIAEIPQRAPEGVRALDRKTQYIVIGVETQTLAALDPLHEPLEIGRGDAGFTRGPQWPFCHIGLLRIAWPWSSHVTEGPQVPPKSGAIAGVFDAPNGYPGGRRRGSLACRGTARLAGAFAGLGHCHDAGTGPEPTGARPRRQGRRASHAGATGDQARQREPRHACRPGRLVHHREIHPHSLELH